MMMLMMVQQRLKEEEETCFQQWLPCTERGRTNVTQERPSLFVLVSHTTGLQFLWEWICSQKHAGVTVAKTEWLWRQEKEEEEAENKVHSFLPLHLAFLSFSWSLLLLLLLLVVLGLYLLLSHILFHPLSFRLSCIMTEMMRHWFWDQRTKKWRQEQQ